SRDDCKRIAAAVEVALAAAAEDWRAWAWGADTSVRRHVRRPQAWHHRALQLARLGRARKSLASVETAMKYDLIIRNGIVVDGSGNPGYRGDVAVSQGRIAAIGTLRESASETIDAGGQVVAPGFVDPHTHYDAQITWDPLLSSSAEHGVTTVLMVNSG